MDLWNAKLQRIDTPGTPDVRGSVTWTQGASIDVRCVLDGPSMAQRMTIGATLKDLEAMLYVAAANVPSLSPAQRVLVQLWDTRQDQAVGSARLYEILSATPRVLHELTHWECALKGV